MKVLLINPTGGYPHEYPPLGLLYIASVLRDAGHDVGFFDEGARHKKNIPLIEYAGEFNPRVCGLAVYTTNVSWTFRTISLLKKALPGCVFVVGGPHATVLPERTMSECKDIDFLVCGEGEATMKELTETLEAEGDISRVKGLYYRDGGDILQTPEREMIQDLDAIPFPMYELLGDFEYKFDAIRAGRRLATLMTSRGCPYDCAFCAAKAVWRGSFRRRSPENVVREMAWLIERYGYDELYFMDDLFAVNRRWLEEFYAAKEGHGVNKLWKCLGRVDVLSYEDYVKMVENGCYLIQFGVESGDNRVLEDINKKITTFQARRAFSEARRAGLNTYGFFIVGHRLDTYQTVLKTIYFAKSLNPDFVSFFCLVPFPGTKLYKYVPEDLMFDWSRIMYSAWGRGLPPVELSSVAPEDLLAFEWHAHMKLYGSLSYLIKNILLSRSRRRLLRRKLRQFALHLAAKAYNILRGRWIFKRYRAWDLSDYVDGDAFGYLWRDWGRRQDFQGELEHHLRERRNFFDILIKYIGRSGAGNVLEVGCGTALDSHHLSRSLEGVNFRAIDLSPEAVEVARRAGESLGSGVELSVGDIGRMEFGDGFFSLVFSQGVMEHFRDPVPAMREQLRVLEPQGYLVVDVPQKYNPYTLYKRRRLWEGIWEYGWETEYSYGELKELGRRLGAEPVEVGAHGYGYFQDYGFSLPLYALRSLAGRKAGPLSWLASMLLWAFSFPERLLGHYFMQNITVVYRKK